MVSRGKKGVLISEDTCGDFQDGNYCRRTEGSVWIKEKVPDLSAHLGL